MSNHERPNTSKRRRRNDYVSDSEDESFIKEHRLTIQQCVMEANASTTAANKHAFRVTTELIKANKRLAETNLQLSEAKAKVAQYETVMAFFPDKSYADVLIILSRNDLRSVSMEEKYRHCLQRINTIFEAYARMVHYNEDGSVNKMSMFGSGKKPSATNGTLKEHARFIQAIDDIFDRVCPETKLVQATSASSSTSSSN